MCTSNFAVVAGALSAWTTTDGLPKREVSGELDNAGQRGPEGGGIMEGLRGRGLSGVWHHGGLEYRRTITLGLVQHSMRSATWKKKEKNSPKTRQSREGQKRQTRSRLHLE